MLDDFPAWSIYVPATFVLVVFLIFLSLLIRYLRAVPQDARAAGRMRRSRRLLWVLTIASAAVVSFMASSMFLRFRALGIDRLNLELIYLWPAPSVVLGSGDLVDARIVRGTRTCGYLEVVTHQGVFPSVSFKDCKAAQALLKDLPLRKR